MGTKFINAVNDSHGFKKAQKNLIHRVRMQRAQHPYLIHSFSPSTNISKLILELTSHWKFHWAGQWWHICCNCCHLPLWNLPRAGTAKGPSGYLPQPQNPSWDIAASIAVHSSFAGFTGGLVQGHFLYWTKCRLPVTSSHWISGTIHEWLHPSVAHPVFQILKTTFVILFPV